MAEDTQTTQTPSSEPPAVVADAEAPAVKPAPAAVKPEPPVVKPKPAPVPATPPRGGFHWGTGRRKASVARVRIKPGDGGFLINGKRIDVYFSEPQDRNGVVEPLVATQTKGSINVLVNVFGGGCTGQAGAIRLGLSRALKEYDSNLEEALRSNNMLSRDPRRVERKKYGQPGARKRFQFSKR
jgi:small subunit ribosomal protein S9